MPPPGLQRALLDAVAPLGIKVLPKVDPCPLESTEETNVGLRDEVLLASLDFHMARILSFMPIRSGLGGIEVLQQIEMEGFMAYTICYFPQHIDGQDLVLHIFTNHWLTRSKGLVDNALGNNMDFRVHDSDISSGIPVPLSVGMGPVGGLLLNEGPHEIVHYHEFQVGSIQVINAVNHFFYHKSSTDLGLGWTPICQDLGIKVTSLHCSASMLRVP